MPAKPTKLSNANATPIVLALHKLRDGTAPHNYLSVEDWQKLANVARETGSIFTPIFEELSKPYKSQ